MFSRSDSRVDAGNVLDISCLPCNRRKVTFKSFAFYVTFYVYYVIRGHAERRKIFYRVKVPIRSKKPISDTYCQRFIHLV
jgi:hypothetical protein